MGHKIEHAEREPGVRRQLWHSYLTQLTAPSLRTPSAVSLWRGLTNQPGISCLWLLLHGRRWSERGIPLWGGLRDDGERG